MRRVIHLALVVWIWLPLSAAAQTGDGKISGIVQDAAQKRPVIGARVSLTPSSGAAIVVSSESLGQFELSGLTPGSYTLEVSHPAYQSYSEVVQVSAGGRLGRLITLTLKAGLSAPFDLQVQVSCVKSHLALAQAGVVLEYWKSKPASASTPADSSVPLGVTGTDGTTIARGLQSGWYRVTVSRAGYQTQSEPPTSELPLYLDSGHAVLALLKPTSHNVTVKVTGYDPVKQLDASPLAGVTVEITALDWDGDDTVIPPISETTNPSGEVTFDILPPLRYRVVAKRLGYAPTSAILDPKTISGTSYPATSLVLAIAPTSLKVELASPYARQSLMVGAVVRLEGVVYSSSAGIQREIVATAAPDGEVSAIFDKLLPGRYSVQLMPHASVMDKLPDQNGFAPNFKGPTAFSVSFYGENTTVELDANSSALWLVEVQPKLARVQGQLVGADRLTDPFAKDWKSARVMKELANVEIQFVENATVNQLPTERKSVSVTTDANGRYQIDLWPGRYGIKLPKTTEWVAYDTDLNGTPSGWPYAVFWTKDWSLPERHAPWIHFDSLSVTRLDLHVHRRQANVSVELRPDPLDPLQVIAVHSPPDYFLNEEVTVYRWPDLGINGTCVLKPSNGAQMTFAPVRDETSGKYYCRAKDLAPGSYTLSATHPRYDFSTASVSFSVPDYEQPGELPPYHPLDASALVPGSHNVLPTPLAGSYKKSTIGTIKLQAYLWNKNLQEWGPPDEEITTIIIVPKDPTYGTELTDKLFMMPPKPELEDDPALLGSYDIYVWWGHRDATLSTQTWAKFSANGPGTYVAVLGDEASCTNAPANSGCSLLSTSNRPPFPGLGSVTLKTYTQAGLAIDGLSVRFEHGGLSGVFDSTTTAPTPFPWPTDNWAVVKSVEDPNWKLVSYENRFLGFVSGGKAALETTVIVSRAMPLTGTVTFAGGTTPVSNAEIRILSRSGNLLQTVFSGTNGSFSASNLDPQSVIVVAEKHGSYPTYLAVSPSDPKNPSISGVNLVLQPIAPPTIGSFTLDRHGLFLTGITRSGDPGLGFNPENAKDALTATWSATITPNVLTIKHPVFYVPGQPGGDQTFDVTDDVQTVWLVDRRLFDKPPLRDKSVEPLSERIELPTTYDQWRALEQQLADNEYKTTKPVYALWSAGVRQSDGSYRGKLRIWTLPHGKMEPVLIVVTRYGAVATLAYQPPTDKPVLQGLRLPRWAAALTDVLGWAATLTKGTELDDLELPKGNIVPAPGGVTASITANEKGFLTYDYGITAFWNEGQETPTRGIWGLAPKWLGTKAKVTIGFKVDGEGRSVSLSGKPQITKSFVSDRDLDKPGSLPKPEAKIRVTKIDVYVNGLLEVLETLKDQPGLANDWVDSFEINSWLEAGFDLRVEVDMTPLVSKLAGLVPLAGPILAPAVIAAKKKKLLEFNGVLEGGFGGRVSKTWRTIYPDRESGSTEIVPYERHHFLGGTSQVVKTSSSDFKLIFRFGFGMNITALRGRLSADLIVQLGAPAGSDAPGVLVTPNPLGSWPMFKKAVGAASIVLRLKGKLGIASVQRKFQWDLKDLTADWNTEGVIRFVPANESLTLLTPQTAPPATFVGGSNVVLTGLYPGGVFATSGPQGAQLLVFTQTDPQKGTMQLMLSRGGVAAWSSPILVAEAPGILDAAVIELSDGTRLVVWSELDAGDLFSLEPKTILKYRLIGADGQPLGEAATIIATDGTAHSLSLARVGDKALLVYLVGDGETAELQQLWAVLFANGAFGAHQRVTDERPIAALSLASNADGSRVVVVTRETDGGIDAYDFDGAKLGQAVRITDGATGSFDAAITPTGELAVVYLDGDDSLHWVTRKSDGALDDRVIAGPASVRELSILVFDDGSSGPALAVVWSTRGEPNKVFGQLFNLSDGSLRAARELLAESEQGAFAALHLSYDSGGLRVVATREGEQTDVVDHYVSPTSLAIVTPDAEPINGDADDSDAVTPGDTTGSSKSGGGCQQRGGGSSPAFFGLALVLLAWAVRRRRLRR
ncbi:MAG: carboxypeptidase regulatory-like domain-containing protein [Myxococcales bacterium]|nr:carboxypeptidase regulatory-like domain-containing protein [Myxococcales bacterium]